MALHDQWNIATDDSFKRRVEIAMLSAAIAISSEATATPNHANRAVRANKPSDSVLRFDKTECRVYSPLRAKLVLNDPGRYTPLYALAICANDPILTRASSAARYRTK